jgi:carboxymethylenebutenolidase
MIAILLTLLAGRAWAESAGMAVGVKQNIKADLFTPDGPGPFPAILVLETSRGLNNNDLAYAQALVRQGYVCLVPAYLETYSLGDVNRTTGFTTEANHLYADLADAADRLARSDKVRGRKVGVVGFSNGGFFATWLAATHKVDAAVSYYGALSGAGTDRELSRFKAVFNADSAPLLLLVGTEDNYRRATRHLMDIMREANSPFQARFYPGAHHEFDRTGGGEADRAAAADAWTRSVAFFAQYLKPP